MKEMVKPIGVNKKIVKLKNKCKDAMVRVYYVQNNCLPVV